ncbi:hypothetical protein G1J88_11340 [Tenacibaculum dicentrarchi]|uniref:hypothetical protein n=1 Tax=Tenacibaculum piscium TaxID=1458515 RepID=UPI001EFCEB96|nr:hypothetical protein [Tenacibaculum piscium]MCG8828974.1 hypothetical protein [Tenacibaculum dicentrarchi]
MRFIKVNAKLNVENRGGIITNFQFLLNVDLIGAFEKDTVLLKGGNILLLNGREYKEISVVDQNDIQKL